MSLVLPPLVAFPWVVERRAGEGASAVVVQARDLASGERVAIKIGKGGAPPAVIEREAALLARIDRRWGPRLLGAGVLPAEVAGRIEGVSAGAPYLVTEWAAGEEVFAQAARGAASGHATAKFAATVAHGVGRALAELHEAGVRHGDVKPANVLVTPHTSERDAARDRSIDLVDLGLARSLSAVDGPLGGTPRYLPPELGRAPGALAAGGAALGAEADLYALGLVLAELLDPQVRAAADPRAALPLARAGATGPMQQQVWRWVTALVATAPGARPTAGWLADRAARVLGLASDESDAWAGRRASVRRAYLKVRGGGGARGEGIDASIQGPAREWLESTGRFGGASKDAVLPLTPFARARLLTLLIGPDAARWPLQALPAGDDALVGRLLALADHRAPTSWTFEDLVRGADVRASAPAFPAGSDPSADDGAARVERIARLARDLAGPSPSVEVVRGAEDEVVAGRAPPSVVVSLARSLLRSGEIGRARVALSSLASPPAEAVLLGAEIARRSGERELAESEAHVALRAEDPLVRADAAALLARLAWDRGDLARAEALLVDVQGASAQEVQALVAFKRQRPADALAEIESALAANPGDEASARLLGVRGLVHHAQGDAVGAALAFARATDLAARAGALLEEATYATGEAAAACDAGSIEGAIARGRRAGLLWERLGREENAARALLSCASAFAAIGARHEADEAADDARRRALRVRDLRAAAFALWAKVETRAVGDPLARDEACTADGELQGDDQDAVRSAARLLVWAPAALSCERRLAVDASVGTFDPPVQWEWWGARARVREGEAVPGGADDLIAALLSLLPVPAPIAARGPALHAAVKLARECGRADAARRFEEARLAASRALYEGTPPPLRGLLADVPWVHAPSGDAPEGADGLLAMGPGVRFDPAQLQQLEALVRALSGRDALRPLLAQVVDALVLWTGVERGLLLMRAPDGRLVPRVARNLAGRDLTAEQLALSRTIAMRALESGEPVVATDAHASFADVHASVHALRLRSVLAVPLLARGEALGVVYLDDRARAGAFGPRELAWVRLVASQAALAIADARDQVILRRAARRAERARAALATANAAQEAELLVTRSELLLARGQGEGTRYPYDAIRGRSEPMRALFALLDKVTASEVPVLIVGESGTGKELVARALHANGPRARGPFVSENCAAVPEPLLESTLFGHVRGAFTGASATRMGLFDVAHRGTLLLDEIGEMSLAMQAKLLRVLQDGEVRPVGSERAHRVDVRVIGATHRDLAAMVAEGAFREDLFYRLHVIAIRVPPLREREGDIPLLVAHLLGKHAPPGKKPLKVTRGALERLSAYPWPGNVRQLENELRRAVVLADERIDVGDLSAEMGGAGAPNGRGTGLDLRSRVDALEGDLLREALGRTAGNQTRAASLLGLSRFGLQKMMKRLNVKVP